MKTITRVFIITGGAAGLLLSIMVAADEIIVSAINGGSLYMLIAGMLGICGGAAAIAIGTGVLKTRHAGIFVLACAVCVALPLAGISASIILIIGSILALHPEASKDYRNEVIIAGTLGGIMEILFGVFALIAGAVFLDCPPAYPRLFGVPLFSLVFTASGIFGMLAALLFIFAMFIRFDRLSGNQKTAALAAGAMLSVIALFAVIAWPPAFIVLIALLLMACGIWFMPKSPIR